MAMPKPLATLGISFDLTYWRKPGLLILPNSLITGCLFAVIFDGNMNFTLLAGFVVKLVLKDVALIVQDLRDCFLMLEAGIITVVCPAF